MGNESKKSNVHAGHRKRLKSQALAHGLDEMPAYQALELLLYYAIPYKDTNELAHRLLSPRRHVTKRYLFRVKFPLNEGECAQFREGLVLEDGYETKPAGIELFSDMKSGIITLVEGKYHQIKRMMQALHNQITHLERISFGPLTLPEDLPRGAWRELTGEEEQSLLDAAKTV